MGLRAIVKKLIKKLIKKYFPKISYLYNGTIDWNYIRSSSLNSLVDVKAKIYLPYHLNRCNIGSFTYISQNSNISFSSIGKFCSIGPNFLCGWGIHPTNGISTSPMFYSTLKQNGYTFSETDKIDERKQVVIGNDVFIGANVTILDGITIGDGAIIGAGAVVSKDIPPYAIAVGVPVNIIRYRFNEEQISKLLKIEWWSFDEEKLKDVESMFFDINKFIEKYG